jgi:hypothetical protein
VRALVGTLYSGENEFEECVASIKRQTYTNYKHQIFSHLPNALAHRTLFQTFLDRKDEFDILIKVDADMVLCSERLFENIVQWMTKHPNMDSYSIAVQDFFTGILINGLNTYRNTNHWNYSRETMFVDIPETSGRRYYFDQIEFAPAAVHCKNPSKYQAFHYGVHRGLKSIQLHHSTSHWAMLEKVWRNFLHTQDVRIGLAVLGAELVYSGLFHREDVDYTNPKMAEELEKYQDFDNLAIQNEIARLRWKNWGFLPKDWRRKLIRKMRSNQA